MNSYGLYAPRVVQVDTWTMTFKSGIGKMSRADLPDQNPPIGGISSLELPLNYYVGGTYTQTPSKNVQAPPSMVNSCFSNPPVGGSLENSGGGL